MPHILQLADDVFEVHMQPPALLFEMPSIEGLLNFNDGWIVSAYADKRLLVYPEIKRTNLWLNIFCLKRLVKVCDTTLNSSS